MCEIKSQLHRARSEFFVQSQTEQTNPGARIENDDLASARTSHNWCFRRNAVLFQGLELNRERPTALFAQAPTHVPVQILVRDGAGFPAGAGRSCWRDST